MSDQGTVRHGGSAPNPTVGYGQGKAPELVRAEEEVSRSEERHSTGNSYRNPGCFHPYASSNNKSAHQPDPKSSVPAWKQIRDRQQSKKGPGKASTFTQKPAKGSKQGK